MKRSSSVPQILWPWTCQSVVQRQQNELDGLNDPPDDAVAIASPGGETFAGTGERWSGESEGEKQGEKKTTAFGHGPSCSGTVAG